jgi:hypothetical protein
MPKYLVTEIQRFENGAIQNPTYAFDDRNKAEAKFHSILASAAVSELPVHSAMIFTDEGFTIDSKCYKHEKEPEPTPEPETESAE